MPVYLRTALTQVIAMDRAEEIRMLRETITNLQWALVQTLKHLEAMGEQMEMTSELAAHIKSTKREIMQLQSKPPSQEVLRKQGELMQQLQNIQSTEQS